MGKYQTKTQLLLEILMDDLKEEMSLSRERMEILADDLDTLKLEQGAYDSLIVTFNSINQLIESEKNSYSSAPTVIEISHINRFREKILKDEWISDLIEGEENYYIGTGIKLKDYRELDKDKIYIFDNLYVRFDGETLLTKYGNESFWYEMDENESSFIKWSDRELYRTNLAV